MEDLSGLVPVVVVVAMTIFSVVAGRRALTTKQHNWNKYIG